MLVRTALRTSGWTPSIVTASWVKRGFGDGGFRTSASPP